MLFVYWHLSTKNKLNEPIYFYLRAQLDKFIAPNIYKVRKYTMLKSFLIVMTYPCNMCMPVKWIFKGSMTWTIIFVQQYAEFVVISLILVDNCTFSY